MKMELLTHFKHSRACASAPGGALDTLLGDATFSQVLLQPDDILSTICQAGLMWAGLDQLFKQSVRSNRLSKIISLTQCFAAI